MKLNTNKSILLIAILIVSVWMFKKTYEKYTSEKEDYSGVGATLYNIWEGIF